MKYFIVFKKQIRINKNPDENPDLPLDFLNLDPNQKSKTNLGMKNFWKICRLAYGFCFFCLPKPLDFRV
jgi:hypothetical protein